MADSKARWMKGSIRRRGNSYEAVVYVGRDATTGRKRYVSKSFRTRKEAEKWRVSMLREYYETGEVFQPSKLTLNEHLDDWMATSAEKSPSTLDFYRRMAQHVRPVLGDLPLARLTPARLQAFYNAARKEKTPRVLKGIHDTLSAAMTHAVRLGLIRENPCRRVEPPKYKPKERPAITAEQVQAFLKAAREERLYSLWLLAVTTALCRGELCGLRWQDVDLENRRLTVRQEMVLVRGKRVLKEPKSGASRAAVPLLPEVVEALRDWKTRQDVERTVAGPLWEDHGLVFCQPNGKPLHPDHPLKRHFRRILGRAGLPEALRIHDLRHAVATVAVSSGVDPKTAQASLRHSRVTTTLGIYAHLHPGLAEQAIQHLRALLPRDDG